MTSYFNFLNVYSNGLLGISLLSQTQLFPTSAL